MVVCADCIVIPNCYRFSIYFSGKRDTCCKCREYKEYVEKVEFFFTPQSEDGSETD
jgi:hypothetical protein